MEEISVDGGSKEWIAVASKVKWVSIGKVKPSVLPWTLNPLTRKIFYTELWFSRTFLLLYEETNSSLLCQTRRLFKLHYGKKVLYVCERQNERKIDGIVDSDRFICKVFLNYRYRRLIIIIEDHSVSIYFVYSEFLRRW